MRTITKPLTPTPAKRTAAKPSDAPDVWGIPDKGMGWCGCGAHLPFRRSWALAQPVPTRHHLS